MDTAIIEIRGFDHNGKYNLLQYIRREITPGDTWPKELEKYRPTRGKRNRNKPGANCSIVIYFKNPITGVKSGKITTFGFFNWKLFKLRKRPKIKYKTHDNE